MLYNNLNNMDIKQFITPKRFDLMAKLLYIKAKFKNINTDFFKKLYESHLITFNNCYEDNGKKNKIDDFLKSFDILIETIVTNGYDEKYPIPIYNKNIINGAHRLMISYFYNIKPSIYETKINENTEYNYIFFLNRKQYPSLDRIYADAMALEYIRHNSNIRVMILHPVAYNPEKIIHLFNIIKQYGYIYYEKRVGLFSIGVNNMIKELYRGEEWNGGMFPSNNYKNCGKTIRCISAHNYPTTIILIDMKDTTKCIELKEKCRSIFGIGKHSLHMSDFVEDTFRISASLLNENSIDFLNRGTNNFSNKSKSLLLNYFGNVVNEKEDYCLTSSIILEMYGLREAKDIDYLHKEDKKIDMINISLHDGKWLTYYHVHKDEIIYNPKYHFYFNGFKFASLDVIKKMKQNRAEPKDIQDIKLIG